MCVVFKMRMKVMKIHALSPGREFFRPNRRRIHSFDHCRLRVRGRNFCPLRRRSAPGQHH